MNAGKGIIHVLYIRDEGSYDSGQNIGFLRGISFWETEEQVQDNLTRMLNDELEHFIDFGDELLSPKQYLKKVMKLCPELDEDWLQIDPEEYHIRLELPDGVERYVEAFHLSIGYSTARVRSDA